MPSYWVRNVGLRQFSLHIRAFFFLVVSLVFIFFSLASLYSRVFLWHDIVRYNLSWISFLFFRWGAQGF